MKNSILVLVSISLFAISCKSDKKTDKEVNKTETVKTEAVKETKSDTKSINFNKESFNFSVTGYGAKDKSYIVSAITFKKFDVTSKGNLLGTKVSIDPLSVDTSKDLNNGLGDNWPAAFAAVRNGNIINGFFNNLKTKGNVTTEIIAVGTKNLNLKVTMNGVSKVVKLDYSINTDGLLTAKGKLDIVDFNANDAFKKFAELCTVAFHQGKSWSEISLEFSVKTK